MIVKRPKTRRQLLDRLAAVRQSMREHATTLPPGEAKDRVRRAGADPWFFFQTYLPHYFSQEAPEFHRDLFDEAGKPGINVLAAPRGFAKSTLITFAETLRRVVFKITPFQIIVKESEDAAIPEVAAVQLELEENPRLLADFGKMKKYGDWADGDFTTTNGCRVLALGVGQSIRGKKHRQYRPGRIVIDDPEKDDHVINPRIVKKRVEWTLQAVYPSLDPDRGILTWLGTKISKRGGLAILQKREGINARTWAAVVNGQSLWPARFPLSRLLQIKVLVGSKAWRTEYMNDPGDDPDATFQESMIHRYRREEVAGLKTIGRFTAIDPSIKETKKHDFKAIITGDVFPEFRGIKGPFYLVTRVWLRQDTLDHMFDEIFRTNKELTPTKIGLETSGGQELLFRDIRALESKYKVRLPIIGLTQSIAKEARIPRLQPLMERAVLLFPDDPEDLDLEELITQLLGFDDDAVHDDGPDALEMFIRLAERATRKVSRVEIYH